MITVEKLSFKQENTLLLKDINLSIERGKLYGLIGHNGSGKSSLIRLLAGEQQPTKGTLKIDNELLHNLSAKQIAKHIAYLPQNLPDARSFTVEELVMLGRYPWQKWLSKATAEDHHIVDAAIKKTQIQDKRTRTVSTLSGGERARAWLGMCLAQQTDYLLLDEPLAALDMVYQVEVLRLIKQLVITQNLGVILIIHDINLAAQFCDHFIALKNGRLCHQGSVADTMTIEVLRQIFGIDLYLLSHPVDGHKVAVV